MLRMLSVMVLGPVAMVLGVGAVPLAAFLAAFSYGRGLFPDRDLMWVAFTMGLAAVAAVGAAMFWLFRLYDRLREGHGGPAGRARADQAQCRTCGELVALHDVVCRRCGALVAPSARRDAAAARSARSRGA